MDPPLVTADELGEGLAPAARGFGHELGFRAFIHLVLTRLDGDYSRTFERPGDSLTTPLPCCYHRPYSKKG